MPGIQIYSSRNHIAVRLASVIFFVLIFFAWHPTYADGETRKLEALNKQITNLQRELRQNDDKRSKLNSQLRNSELKAAEASKQLLKLTQQIKDLNKELGALEKKQITLREKRSTQGRLVARELEAAHRLGNQEPLRVLFNLEEPDQINRVLKYYEYVVNARKNILLDYKNTLAHLTTVETSLAEKRGKLEASRSQVETVSAQLQAKVGERKTVLAAINKKLDHGNSRMKDLQQKKVQLEKVINTLERSIARLEAPNRQSFAEQKGKLPWPVQGKIRNFFGQRRNADLHWSGWLLGAKQATEVAAIHYGRVVFADYLRGHGLLLIIDHGEGYLSLYAHNQVLLKEIGNWVSTGEIIARVGNTGGLDSSALYFEIRHQGKAVDPKPWLRPNA
ncbi:MAG TPA: ATPase [Porticoccaceae bacterium]|nr:ATPase [Porticoccaceae bacterium]